MRFKKGRKAGIRNSRLPAKEEIGTEREEERTARMVAAYWAGVAIIKAYNLKHALWNSKQMIVVRRKFNKT